MYKIHTDGACSGNNSRFKCDGGYGYVITKTDADHTIIIEGGGHCSNTTNNRMEMTAVIESLKRLKKYNNGKNGNTTEEECVIITDSKYVCENWNDYFDMWKSRGWIKSNGASVLNIDLWKAIDNETSDFKSVEFSWVKGHANNSFNIKADELAKGNIKALRRLSCSK